MKNHRCSMVLALAWTVCVAALGAGIPEPGLVLYGTVRNTADNNARVVSGTLRWQFRKVSSGRTVTVTAALTNIIDQFSFVVQVPSETIIAGFDISADALDLTPTAAAFDWSAVTLDSRPVTFATASPSSGNIASTDRGSLVRVDLLVNIPITDRDGNGLPDDWEMRFFGYVGVNPNGDEDHDGMSNLAEYRAGTDPTDPNSFLKFISYSAVPGGGFRVVWSSVEGRLYTLERSTNLLSKFTAITNHIAATPPTNSYLDSGATGAGPYFYRLRLE
jgi:hypothetical protein